MSAFVQELHMYLHSLSVEVIQACFDVCVIVIDLFLIESCL